MCLYAAECVKKMKIPQNIDRFFRLCWCVDAIGGEVFLLHK